jgi:hydrogenase expression/formation protein HypD
VSAGDPLRNPRAVKELTTRIVRAAEGLERPLKLMEVCGTHTHAIAEAGVRHLLPESVRLISGPGCPVCVTPVSYVDRAEALAQLPGHVVCTFGDLVRVPSTSGSLERARAEGARVEIVYSARDAVRLAQEHPDERIVFLGVGFETTAPTIAAALAEAESAGVGNFTVLSGHKVMPPAMRGLVDDPGVQVDGFLLPGHVSVVTGAGAFSFLADELGLPGVVVGFTPVDVLRGVLEIVEQRAAGRAEVVNLYRRAVPPGGNPIARQLLERFFAPVDSEWRGLGTIPGSGLGFARGWERRDAARIEVALPEPSEPAGCRCGEVLRGTIEPPECPLFAGSCTPDTAVGACMVSSEGACSAYYRHDRWHRTGAAAP